MKPLFKVGDQVSVLVGGCRENRFEAVVTSVHALPELVTYEVRFTDLRPGAGFETRYLPEHLTRIP
jgi:hypothetical protein